MYRNHRKQIKKTKRLLIKEIYFSDFFKVIDIILNISLLYLSSELQPFLFIYLFNENA